MTAVIESSTYEETRERLSHDPIVEDMAYDLMTGVVLGIAPPRDQLWNDEGEPTFEMMQRANAAYDERGGEIHDRHIGAVAEAVIRVYERVGLNGHTVSEVCHGEYTVEDLLAEAKLRDAEDLPEV